MPIPTAVEIELSEARTLGGVVAPGARPRRCSRIVLAAAAGAANYEVPKARGLAPDGDQVAQPVRRATA